MSDTTTEIEEFVRGIRRRNRREVIVALLLLLVFGLHALKSPVGSLAFWGHLLILLAILFIVGMMCSVASLRGDLRRHPANDFAFWRAEVLRQARLLRLVPLWYIAPLVPGLALALWPTVLHVCRWANPIDNAIEVVGLLVIVAVLSVVWRLNVRGSAELERKAERMKEREASLVAQPTS